LRPVVRGAPSRLPLARRSAELFSGGVAPGAFEGRRDGAPRTTDRVLGHSPRQVAWRRAGRTRAVLEARLGECGCPPPPPRCLPCQFRQRP